MRSNKASFSAGGEFAAERIHGALNFPLSTFDPAALPAAGDKLIVLQCGSGVTASVLALALARLGRQDVAVYDGSWSEWGGSATAPVVTGAA